MSKIGWSGADRDRLSARLAILAFAICVLLLLWMLARTFWLLVPGSEGLNSGPLRTANLASATPGVSVSKWHLFGNAPQQAARMRNAPATTLSLNLRGTLADADPKSGLAVIADAQGLERAWRVGEEIAPGVTLDEVHADRVVLIHDGVEEVLALARDEASERVAPIPSSQRGGRQARNTSSGPATSPGPMPVFVPPQIAHGAVDWQKTMNKIGGSSADLARNMRIDPVISNGQIAGVRVSAANGDSALMAKFGLRPSDIVTAVNGVPVDSVARGQQIIESLGSASSVRVTVNRGGVPTDITVKLE
ncbi:MAG TPA: type II secretion system protein N [Dokdonella sp.]|uniref:type II secretion system protein N n=1 Tax=Dokdonella sp. TaxID=2291710 RepID=UPI002D7F73A7|nr:type II secretion system protein N [Dokdonella sp.]HET9033652.1 type II secretion system protein N [Dokdonella sp.]